MSLKAVRKSRRRIAHRVSLAVLAHDLAKPDTTLKAMKVDRRRVVSLAHEQTGGLPPIVMGRRLIERGSALGKETGAVLRAAYEAQLDGEFSSLPEALRWLGQARWLSLPDPVRCRLPRD